MTDLHAAALEIRCVGHFTEAFRHLVDGPTPRNVHSATMQVQFCRLNFSSMLIDIQNMEIYFRRPFRLNGIE